ncbi:unnamed protein product [Gongylonema pulchrum]|uniref:Inner membrane protein n=1 Tax=Gongylonema pulchrum TaxID=637853 RepID=A0A183E9B9_9BILA|nr:unnamed protein product [Gongylonema pulchrum]VDN30028.1 unnamed protein product [Gongylonema pulchrum]
MDGLLWLIVSWLVVGAMCYLMLSKLGAPQAEVASSVHPTTAPSTATSSGAWSTDQQSTTDWLNGIITWLFENMHRAPDTLQAWIAAMNEAAKKISSPVSIH